MHCLVKCSVLVLCYSTLMGLVSCQSMRSLPSLSATGNSGRNYTNNYWETSAPSMVNLIYTWFHPDKSNRVLAKSHKKAPTTMNIKSSNNRVQGTQGSSHTQGFHPHFGPMFSWETTSRVTHFSNNVTIVERGRPNDESYAIYYSECLYTSIYVSAIVYTDPSVSLLANQ